MKGYHVERRFGWDTHGLPIEHEIDKKLGISGKDAVMKLGLAKYNEECRAIVMRFSTEWRATIDRLGRWVDFDNDYKASFPTLLFVHDSYGTDNGSDIHGVRVVGVQTDF
jgi:isoleucyl-tRNA synthetase